MARLFESVTVHIHRDDEPCPAWHATPLGAATVASAINGTVQDSGGGTVTVLVDRSTPSYPEVGEPVLLFHGAPVGVTTVATDASGHSEVLDAEPVWSLRRILAVLTDPDEPTERGDIERAHAMLRWHADYADQLATTERQRCCERGYFGDDHDCMKQPGKADGARLATAEDPGPFMRTTHGDDVVDAEIHGEFTDAQAAMIVALVAAARASGATHSLGLGGFVRKAADLVRTARDNDTPPGWDEGDLEAVVYLMAT